MKTTFDPNLYIYKEGNQFLLLLVDVDNLL